VRAITTGTPLRQSTPGSSLGDKRELEMNCRDAAGLTFACLFSVCVQRLNFQMTVLGIVFLHAAILRHIFCIFFHVMHRRIGHNSGCAHSVSDMSGKSHSTATDFPRTAIISCGHELIGAVAFRQASP